MSETQDYKILVLLKPGDEQPAMDRVAEFARLLPEQVKVVACRVINKFTQEDMENQKAQALRAIQALVRKYPSIPAVEPLVVFNKDVPEAFIEVAAGDHYAMAVIAANKRNTIKDLFVNTIDSQVLRGINVPLLIVKDAQVPQKMGKAILLAIYLNKPEADLKNQSLLTAAKVFAAKFNGEVCVANVVEPEIRGIRTGSVDNMMNVQVASREKVQNKIMSQFAEKYDINRDSCFVLYGRIDEEVPKLAAKVEARMICMSTSVDSASGVFGAMGSSASEIILEQVQGDLFVINGKVELPRRIKTPE